MSRVHRAFNHATPEKPSKEYWIGTPKPKAPAPSKSWWTDPDVQRDRAKFREVFEREAARFVADPTFGGFGRVHDSGLDSDR